jgi:hypothetical protein
MTAWGGGPPGSFISGVPATVPAGLPATSPLPGDPIRALEGAPPGSPPLTGKPIMALDGAPAVNGGFTCAKSPAAGAASKRMAPGRKYQCRTMNHKPDGGLRFMARPAISPVVPGFRILVVANICAIDIAVLRRNRPYTDVCRQKRKAAFIMPFEAFIPAR